MDRVWSGGGFVVAAAGGTSAAAIALTARAAAQLVVDAPALEVKDRIIAAADRKV